MPVTGFEGESQRAERVPSAQKVFERIPFSKALAGVTADGKFGYRRGLSKDETAEVCNPGCG